MKRMHFYIGGAAGMIALLAVLGAWFERISIKAEAAKQAAEAKRKANWIANFPFKPTPHPTLTFDPKVLEDPGMEFDQFGFPIRDEHRDELRRRRSEMLNLLERHRFLSAFYNDYENQRYSPGFEQMHHILAETPLETDPVIWGRVFTQLVDYHRASRHDPEKPFPVKQLGITWGERKEREWRGMIGWLTWRSALDGKGHETLLSGEEAEAVAERLINEIPAELFINQPIMAGHYKYEKMLKAGDALLIR